MQALNEQPNIIIMYWAQIHTGLYGFCFYYRNIELGSYVAYIAGTDSASKIWYRYFVGLDVRSKPEEGVDVIEWSHKGISFLIASGLCKVGNRLDGIVG